MVKLSTRNEIPVWWIATEGISRQEGQRVLNLLGPDERDRADRFHFQADRRDFLIAHALLRSMLRKYVNNSLPEWAWRFQEDENGKPKTISVAGAPEFQFNLSHTRGLVAVGLASDGQIGVDVEKIDLSKTSLEMAEAYFAPSEVELLCRAPEADRVHCFFRLWTLKEAYLKAVGIGLGIPLDSFAFTFDPIRINFRQAPNHQPENWLFEILPTTGQHILSIAAWNPGGKIRVVPHAATIRDLLRAKPSSNEMN